MSNVEYSSRGLYHDFRSALTFVSFRAFLGTDYYMSWKKENVLFVSLCQRQLLIFQSIKTLFASLRIWPAYGSLFKFYRFFFFIFYVTILPVNRLTDVIYVAC